MSSVFLYNCYGKIGNSKESISFEIPLTSIVCDRIEDQGVIVNENIRIIQFKYVNQENKTITLEFQYQELKQYNPLLIKSDEEQRSLLKEAIKSIHYLNKKQYKLLEFDNSNIFIRNKNSKNLIYFFHFEQDQSNYFENEVKTLKYIILSYFKCFKDYLNDDDWKEVSNFTQMKQVFNSKFIKSLYSSNQQSEKIFNEMKEFYQYKERQHKVLEKNFIQDILNQLHQKQIQGQEIEICINLIKINIIAQQISHDNNQLGQDLTIILQDLHKALRNDLMQKDQIETGSSFKIDELLEKIKCILQPGQYQNQRYSQLSQSMARIMYIQKNSFNICQNIKNELHLPYEKYINIEELIIAIEIMISEIIKQ
ncbi:hypothetical protein pb186bvf_017071 [Paramecium bursaria]